MISPIRSWQDKALAWFDAWFTSPECVWQTLFACIVICVVEVAFPSLDPHYFYLLAILTLYSAITQPALAQASAATTKQLQTIIERQAGIIEMMHQELAETNEILDDVRELTMDTDEE